MFEKSIIHDLKIAKLPFTILKLHVSTYLLLVGQFNSNLFLQSKGMFEDLFLLKLDGIFCNSNKGRSISEKKNLVLNLPKNEQKTSAILAGSKF
jgi:hypothetical protein